MFEVEFDVLEGLEPYALEEIRVCCGCACSPVALYPGRIRVRFTGDLHVLFRLRSVVAAYLIVTYDVPRPRALLGHQHLTRLLTTLELVRSLTKPEYYRTLRLSAADPTLPS